MDGWRVPGILFPMEDFECCYKGLFISLINVISVSKYKKDRKKKKKT